MYPLQPAYVCLKLLGSECRVLLRLVGESTICRYSQVTDIQLPQQ